MNIRISTSQKNIREHIHVTGSKSESNRLLLLKALYPSLTIENLSNSDDSQFMEKGVEVENGVVDIHHAGTAMRFLTAFFSVQPGKEVLLTGSKRMTERPISILVDALRSLGANIAYEGEEGYPPLKITGKKISASRVSLASNVSSQYISALMLVAPSLENGLEIALEGKTTSIPYINMTLKLLREIGVECSYEDNLISVKPGKEVKAKTLTVESDWSSASYFYGVAALSDSADISIESYKQDSLQGDSVLTTIYKELGVTSSFNQHELNIKHSTEDKKVNTLELDLSDAPDIAQTIAVSCFGLGIGCKLKGLHTLKIKETDRLEALKTELSKLGATIEVTDKELFLAPSGEILKEIAIDTYNDHRMAMAFAPLALKVPIVINDAEVVSKSYPDYWNDLEKMGFVIEEI